MKNYVILENIRSAYNVWNLFRTADALNWWIVISGYTPSPHLQPKVAKTALWAEKSVDYVYFEDSQFDTQKAIQRAKSQWFILISAEITENSISLKDFVQKYKKEFDWQKIAVVLWNEVAWVEQSTLDQSDFVVHIPMLWIKNSLNVWQAWAIFMRELSNL